MWNGGLVQFDIIPFLQGSGPFVEAFNFCFTLICICGVIAAVLKIMIKIISRS